MGNVERCDKTLPVNEMIYYVRRDAALRERWSHDQRFVRLVVRRGGWTGRGVRIGRFVAVRGAGRFAFFDALVKSFHLAGQFA